MKIQVTMEHINKGKPSEPFECALAWALRDATGKAIGVHYGPVFIDGKPCLLPPEAKAFMMRFDDLKPVEPFEFELVCQEGR